jgi:predicted transcriptional regulator
MSNSVKRDAEQLVRDLPEQASWDDLMYEIYVRQKIEEGLQAADTGRVLTHEEVKRRFARDR